MLDSYQLHCKHLWNAHNQSLLQSLLHPSGALLPALVRRESQVPAINTTVHHLLRKNMESQLDECLKNFN